MYNFYVANKPSKEETEMMTTNEAAQTLGVTRQHIVNLLNAGILEGYKVTNRLWLVNRQSLEGWKRQRAPKGGNIEG